VAGQGVVTSEMVARAFRRSYNEQISQMFQNLDNATPEYRTARNTVWTANDLTWETPTEDGSN
jgi:hypothetical protein